MKQIITIQPDGTIVGLEHKKKGLNLRQFGKADIKRLTLIEWCDHFQMWHIQWTEDHKAAATHPSLCWCKSQFAGAGVSWEDHAGLAVEDDGTPDCTIYFEHYEDAVGAEVAVIQAMQESGQASEIFR